MKDEIVLDLETKKSFQEVGGKYNMHLLGVSVVGVYSYKADEFYAFEEAEFRRLEELLRSAARVIGFNSKHFDFPVLQPHVRLDLKGVAHLDLMEDVEQGAGFRISLDNLAQASLGVGKSSHGLQAITWWKEGNIEAIKKYCLDDVRITRDLYEYGKKNGFVAFDSRDARAKLTIPVTWDKDYEPTGNTQASLF
ncbi:MAG: hypothetical protein A3C84_04900 [Candidatus Ryanbacteria bacterium RIFCSPHIGHO2_02_FULL_48_12]|uniref:YprB ribonuclease H-like domain-containing protein n=1 Tax=Candidatus Ryanbacteria bacterium RIFCSPHIGHO2_01_FULL_48_27 TaxID=1802115 RepID=A0A1G2G7L6_9BACT|nr:MAG: hypothetical protein A2756_06225 [Candidatus Ryanbacteria bacterium RIFCSPHIGHO2_01_FULL_48_27]OGZ49509.1 MAG: hypothetical protein A3C84_04900 [Candidatus Ryanbacteria bacterium RIFCSPHIGHO2_02_FULL_48_12]